LIFLLWFSYPARSRTRVAGIAFQLLTTVPPWLPWSCKVNHQGVFYWAGNFCWTFLWQSTGQGVYPHPLPSGPLLITYFKYDPAACLWTLKLGHGRAKDKSLKQNPLQMVPIFKFLDWGLLGIISIEKMTFSFN